MKSTRSTRQDRNHGRLALAATDDFDPGTGGAGFSPADACNAAAAAPRAAPHPPCQILPNTTKPLAGHTTFKRPSWTGHIAAEIADVGAYDRGVAVEELAAIRRPATATNRFESFTLEDTVVEARHDQQFALIQSIAGTRLPVPPSFT